jgi:hypothetical protein
MIIQLVINGLAMGAIYALVALGMVIIYNAAGVVNFAQGEFVMVGAFVSYTMLAVLKLPYPLAFLAVLRFLQQHVSRQEDEGNGSGPTGCQPDGNRHAFDDNADVRP